MRLPGANGPRRAVAVLTLALIGAGVATPGGSAGAATASRPVAVITALPVVSCPTTYAGGKQTGTFVARQLPATTSVRGLSFYSNGVITVLGPAGWTCHALDAADGSQKLDVSAPGTPDYSLTPALKGASVVEVDVDDTGHLPGAEGVCALFPRSAAAAEVRAAQMPCPTFRGEKSSNLTADVVTFSDPPRVTGTGAGSGGALTSTGAAVYPQLTGSPDTSVTTSVLSCTLPRKTAALCAAIRADFVVRNPPISAGSPQQ